MKDNLNLKAYKIQVQQPLSSFDARRRDEFSNIMINRFESSGGDHIDINKIWFSDEAHFMLNGYVNKQNHRFWATENPHFAISKSLHPARVTVWCAMSSLGIIGPVFLEQNVTGSTYRKMLEDKFIPKIQEFGETQNFWFMQDGARPHRTAEVFGCLFQYFGQNVIGLDFLGFSGGGVEWPPYSPDLNPCDFFLWGYLKDRIYKKTPRNLEKLKTAIVDEIRGVEEGVIKCVISSFETRLRDAIATQGSHFENIIH